MGSTENALNQLRAEQTRLSVDVGSTAEQIRHLENKLATARASHQSETQLVDVLRSKQAEQRSVAKTLTEEVIRAESELSALKMEKAQIEDNLLRDKEEIRDMKKKMSELEEQTQQMRTVLESLKKDSRLQKGLIAISKKQVLTSETQGDQVAKELSLAQGGSPSDLNADETSRTLTPVPTGLVRPKSAASAQKSTNPFANMSIPTLSQTIDHTQVTSPTSTVPKASDPFLTTSDSTFATNETHEGGFSDAFGFEPPNSSAPQTPSHAFTPDAPLSKSGTPTPVSPSAPVLQTAIAQSDSNDKSPEEQHSGNEDDSSSDEDEIEDVFAAKVGSSSKAIERPSSADLKFPPLTDAHFISPSSENTQHPDRPPTLKQANDSFFSARSESFEDLPKSSTGAAERSSSSGLESAQIGSSLAMPLTGFGDELEVADFTADFGPEASKVHAATMEDFDSAFANLPMPSKAGDPTGPSSAAGAIASFDDTFGDNFVANINTPSHAAFDDAFSGFDSAFSSQPNPPPTSGQTRQTDPFASSSSKQAPPPPPRGQSAKPGPDQPRPDDSEAVKQICGMGFPRQVAIDALEKDEWDMERALNHLLGT